MTAEQEVFLGIGGNVGDVLVAFEQVFKALAEMNGISSLTVAPYYLTSPVSEIPQRPYLNTVCRFRTTLELTELAQRLRALEAQMGKRSQVRTAPRPIDIDLLFYGTTTHHDPDLQVPHPRWRERLFVLRPLADLCPTVQLSGGEQVPLQPLIQSVSQQGTQWVWPLDDLPFTIKSRHTVGRS